MLRIDCIIRASAATAGLLLAIPAAGEPIEVESVLLASIEEREVPAQEAGVLSRLAVREGASSNKMNCWHRSTIPTPVWRWPAPKSN